MSGKMLALFFLLAALCTVENPSYAQRSRSLMHLEGLVQGGRLGVMIQDVTQDVKKEKDLSVSSGALVTDVMDESAAEKAGIEEGDVIVKFGDRQIENGDDLVRAVRKAKTGTDIQIEVVRKTEHKTLTARLKKDRGLDSYSFNFTPPVLPKIPRMRFHWRSFGENAMSGMEVQELSKQLADYFEAPDHHGLLVTDVESGSEADKAGVKAGDVIVKVGDESVRDIEDLSSGLSDTKDHEANLTIIRKGKQVNLKLHVEEDDDDDASVIRPGVAPSLCPDHSSRSIGEKLFSKKFLHDMMESIHDLKSQILKKVEDATSRIRIAFVKLSGGQTETRSSFRQS